MDQPAQILKKYWGYDQFRPGQEAVVNHILTGRDAIALMPTGGGKSVCFQVPGMMHGGLTLVISPLISLIKDQVDGLIRRDIPAVALHSGLSYGEMRLKMENALKGAYRFMYISPERLATENFREYLPNLNVKLLVVDEAHCISQWGYDFRPAYLRIAECRQWLNDVPVAAFTASAPPYVVKDIADKLALKEPAISVGDFSRNNLHFHVRETEDKAGFLVRMLTRTAGSSLVFVRNRRETEETSNMLRANGISCDFYHAGLSATDRSRRQDAWMKGRTRVMVCTNAFGMGIDKPDVRFVIHLSPPPSPEDYYQEAGRAGRDGLDSWCILLYRRMDIEQLRVKVDTRFPGRDMLARVYTALMNHLGIPDGGGMMQLYEFDPHEMAGRYKFQPSELLHGLHALEILNLLSLSEGVMSPSRVHFTMDYASVYDFKLRNPKLETVLDVLLRSHGGIFDEYVRISEKVIARRLHMDESQIAEQLQLLARMEVIDYQQASDRPKVMITEPRSPYPVFDIKILEPLRRSRHQAIDTMEQYMHCNICRSAWWISYFTGRDADPCRKCDICALNKKKGPVNADNWISWLRDRTRKAINRTELLDDIQDERKPEILDVLRGLMDDGKIVVLPGGEIQWKEEV